MCIPVGCVCLLYFIFCYCYLFIFVIFSFALINHVHVPSTASCMQRTLAATRIMRSEDTEDLLKAVFTNDYI